MLKQQCVSNGMMAATFEDLLRKWESKTFTTIIMISPKSSPEKSISTGTSIWRSASWKLHPLQKGSAESTTSPSFEAFHSDRCGFSPRHQWPENFSSHGRYESQVANTKLTRWCDLWRECPAIVSTEPSVRNEGKTRGRLEDGSRPERGTFNWRLVDGTLW